MKNIILPIAIVAILLVAGWFAPATIVENLGAIAGPDIYGYLTVHGPFAQGGGVKTVTQQVMR